MKISHLTVNGSYSKIANNLNCVKCISKLFATIETLILAFNERTCTYKSKLKILVIYARVFIIIVLETSKE